MPIPHPLTALRRIVLAAATAAAVCVPAWASAWAQEVVLIPSRVIYPGETISAGALRQVTLVPGKVKPDAVATTLAELDGKVARRTLLPGRYIPTAALRNAWLVEQGASVQVNFIAGGLTISATAVTLQPGSPGDVVKVRNVDSGKVLTGTVMEDGSIRVGT
ncbi:flagellar basal body P-ring formation chaperone FlgA [Aquamicrobium terrae]|uniref:Flagella basal body P-ring formation protein FlgA n=1 Tax=Aquamicrobium terrae TaxID=1324945 RepID=A0ABV2MXZ5_9HYPH